MLPNIGSRVRIRHLRFKLSAVCRSQTRRRHR